MLVTFRTDAHAGITMFGDIAKLMLKKMGLSETIPGAILAEDVPAVLNTLTNAIKIEKESSIERQKSAWDDQGISQQSRAMPLIELLKAAAEQECNVMWEEAGITEPGISI
ncbi:DUF1840 domain-containing protein [Thiomicrorhabdus lithotrophica]|uniref:DUF1840 domain-containing protein n=1 Tax=Thiomicrorhabdus lithotrophica TaxID=2949997 RepID=A0ABY8C6R3_9GAMM|nr:DUF1840 domain-containing protein [Thiomicrorhabdus lithotrophica]WEJ61660.1 DUF1840 domain-containing protein [Thiomicrorhabdus lithotrophica]